MALAGPAGTPKVAAVLEGQADLLELLAADAAAVRPAAAGARDGA